MSSTTTLVDQPVTYIPRLVLRNGPIESGNFAGPAQNNIVDANTLVGTLPSSFLDSQIWTGAIDQATDKDAVLNNTSVGENGEPSNLTVWGTSTLKDDVFIGTHDAPEFIFDKNNGNHEFQLRRDGHLAVFDTNYTSSGGADLSANQNVVIDKTGITIAYGKSLSVAGSSTLTGGVTASSTLGVTGATTLSSTLSVSGKSTLSDYFSHQGVFKITAQLSVEGSECADASANNEVGKFGILVDSTSNKAWALKVSIYGVTDQDNYAAVAEYYFIKSGGTTTPLIMNLARLASNSGVFRILSDSETLGLVPENKSGVTLSTPVDNKRHIEFRYFRNDDATSCHFRIVCEFANLVGTANAGDNDPIKIQALAP